MAVKLEGTNRRILMPDGRYLTGEAWGTRSDWCTLHDGYVIASGTDNLMGAAKYVAFPYSFSQVFHIVVCEAGATGWTDWQNNIGWGSASIYGVSGQTTSGFTVEGWALQGGGAVNTKNPTGYGFCWLAWGKGTKWSWIV